MLTIQVPAKEFYNEATGEFENAPACTLQLEHSLISLSKWESKWKKPFVTQDSMGIEEFLDYVRCMTINQKVDPLVYKSLTHENLEAIKNYIHDPATATTVYDRRQNKNGRRDIITSEVIYWQMIYFGIPFECEKWHLNRLLMLIKVCTVKGTNNQMSMTDIFAQNKQLNAARRAAMHSKG